MTHTQKFCVSIFLSTLSLRRATGCQRPCEHPTRDFYPRSPCGERHKSNQFAGQYTRFLSTLSLRRATRVPETLVPRHYQFLSTLSLRRATSGRPGTRQRGAISIHALLAESDDVIAVITDAQSISIHALLAESDVLVWCFCGGAFISIHALLAESDFGRAFWPGLSL